jgi:uncharacterized protein YrrD
MLWSSKRILGLKVAATDGAIGSIHDIYFEDEAWSIRYFVVDTGGWLSGRRVLLSPRALGRPDRDAAQVPASLTQEQVRNSPPYDFAQPISLQYETELAGYYTWPDPSMYPISVVMAAPPVPTVVPGAVHAAAVERTPGPHLRSIRDLFGYAIHVRGGEIGTAEDFIVDDRSWRIDRIVVETGTWFSGRKVAVPSRYSRRIRWSGQVIYMDVAKDEIERLPEFYPKLEVHEPVTRA